MSQYFQGLNYSLANEDTKVEYDLLPEGVDSVFTVCGSGSRVLPLMAKNPKEITVVDLSPTQLALCRLRIAAAKSLSYEDFLYFLGYRKKGSAPRRDLLNRLGLSAEDQKLWEEIHSKWEHEGFIYLGRWESHFMKLGRVFSLIPGVNLAPLFAASSLEEQKKILHRHWHPRLFRLFTKIVLGEWVSNRLLYKGSFAGSKERRTSSRSPAELVGEEFNDLFAHTWVRSNYFLNMIFLGEVSYEEAYPIEATRDVYERVRNSGTKIHYTSGNLLKLVEEKAHDFYSLSDTFSYMEPMDLKNFLPGLPPGVKEGSQMVIRTFMRSPYFTVQSPWSTDENLNQALAKKDCTRVYEFLVLKKDS